MTIRFGALPFAGTIANELVHTLPELARRLADPVVRLVSGTDRTIAEAPAKCPAILHVTHYKAGSQWLYKILHDCAGLLLGPPTVKPADLLKQRFEANRVYPTLYLTREEFDQLRLPRKWRRFVVIRDLRDTLISFYFSLKVSHPVVGEHITRMRNALLGATLEGGLLHLVDACLEPCARIQRSWLAAGERLIRYEALLSRDLEILEPLLLTYCELPVTRARFREVVAANRFERLTGGRSRGTEDTTAHERKGVAGDWRNYFTPAVTDAFKERYGDLLVATGYEKDLDW